MNSETLISVHCYAGDADIVRMLLPYHERHRAPIVVLSPVDSPVRRLGPHICRHAGRRSYIGQVSLDRQIAHLKVLLEYPFNYFLLNDADSFCVSAEIPRALYERADGTLWSGIIGDWRPHESRYPKIAAQPPYFLSRGSLEKIVAVAPRIRAHAITPYIDWAMMAWACEAGLTNRSFGELERPTDAVFSGSDSWEALAFRIRHMGAVMMHPIKTPEQRDLCVAARNLYES